MVITKFIWSQIKLQKSEIYPKMKMLQTGKVMKRANFIFNKFRQLYRTIRFTENRVDRSQRRVVDDRERLGRVGQVPDRDFVVKQRPAVVARRGASGWVPVKNVCHCWSQFWVQSHKPDLLEKITRLVMTLSLVSFNFYSYIG